MNTRDTKLSMKPSSNKRQRSREERWTKRNSKKRPKTKLNLPPQLLEAFRSTLEETLDADQLLLVVDLSDPAWREQLATVHAILDELGSTAPRRLIGNQIDRCPASALEQARAEDAQVIFVSATAGLGLEHLRDCLFGALTPEHDPL